MYEENKIYTSGVWQVKEGQEENFKSLWKEFADDGIKNRNTLEAVLLQEYDNPKSFVSFGIWENIESIKQWQNTAEMKVFASKFDKICDIRQIKTFKPAMRMKK